MKRIVTILAILCGFLVSSAQSVIRNAQAPKYEVRAVWLTTIGGIDWPHSYAQSQWSAEKQKQELRHILDRLKEAKINTVLLQTRVRGTMIYPSEYEPWDGCLSGNPGKSPGYDALQFAIDECHKRGMELHAWVVTIPVGKWNALGCKRLRNRYAKLIRKIGPDGYMNPEDSRTADYLANICSEITHKYNVDGIHLDYIRYPETWDKKINREQGRAYVTRIVKKIHDAVKQEKPWVKMSCAPIGKFDDLSRYWSHGWNAYTKVCQDAQEWLRTGLMDQLYPMMYFRDDQFFPFAIDWQENCHGKTIVPGLGIYFLDPKEGKWNIDDVVKEMYHLRNIGEGYAFFRNKFFMDNKQGIYDFTAKGFNLYPALVPAMTWASDKRPLQPRHLKLATIDDKMVMTWSNERQYEDNSAITTPYIYNNVYASRSFPVDITDARNLIATRLLRDTLMLKSSDDSQTLYYAVTAMDGFGNESLPTQSMMPGISRNENVQGMARVLKNDGKTLLLPETAKMVDNPQATIENLQGRKVCVLPIKGNRVDIRQIQEGIYLVRIGNQHGRAHVVGTFRVKR